MFHKLSVPDQNANNFFKLTDGENGCCPEGGESVCQSTVTYTQANTVTVLNITEGGVARALPAVPATTSAADVKAALLAALIAAGYEDDTDATYPGITVVDNGTTLTVTITGRVTPVSLTTSGGAAAFDQDCTLAGLCTYVSATNNGGAAGSLATRLRINGVDYDLGAITAGTTTTGQFATAVQSAMTTAGISGTAAVTSTGSSTATLYTVTITLSEASNDIYLAGARLTRSACTQYFV